MERYAGLSRREIRAMDPWRGDGDSDLALQEVEIFGPPLDEAREVYVEDLGHFDNNDKASKRQEQHDLMKGRDESRGI